MVIPLTPFRQIPPYPAYKGFNYTMFDPAYMDNVKPRTEGMVQLQREPSHEVGDSGEETDDSDTHGIEESQILDFLL